MSSDLWLMYAHKMGIDVPPPATIRDVVKAAWWDGRRSTGRPPWVPSCGTPPIPARRDERT